MPKHAAEEGGEEEESSQPALRFTPGSDVCKALMDRYGKSSAPQHRHLCASAAAIRSILQEEGLPLTPTLYFAAVITAMRDADASDHGAVATFSAFLAILLPFVPSESLPPCKTKDAAGVLAARLQDSATELPTGAVRSIVKSLGVLVLQMDLEDWFSFKLPLQVLVALTVDKRPKVRRSAQVSVEKVFEVFKSFGIIKKSSKVMLSLYKKYISLAAEMCTTEMSGVTDLKELPKSEHPEIIHMLIVLKLIVPYLSEKVRMEIFSDAQRFLSCASSSLTRHVIELVDSLIQQTEANILLTESDKIIFAFTSYLSSTEKNPDETIVSRLKLLRNLLNKLHTFQPTIWISKLPLVFMSVKEYLDADDDISEVVAEILKDLINVQIDLSLSLPTANQSCDNIEHSNYQKKKRIEHSSPEISAIVNIISSIKSLLDACTSPTGHMLGVISVLFLKLGKMSNLFMTDILLKLSRYARKADANSPSMESLCECIGSAVTALGHEVFISIPLSFNENKFTISNIWMIPILKKNMRGASLQFFMEHIFPLVKCVQQACAEVTSTRLQQRLKTYVRQLWDLLPAFCHYPTDTSESFDSLAKTLLDLIKNDSSLHEVISISLQTLVMENLGVLQAKQDMNQHAMVDSLGLKSSNKSQSFAIEYTKETASKNIEALTSNSMVLIQTLADVFFGAPPEKHAVLKDAIESLSSLVRSDDLHKFFLSLLKKFDQFNTLEKSNKLCENDTENADKKEENKETSTTEKIQERCLVVKLVSSFIQASNGDLVNLIFDFIKSSLLATDTTNKADELFALRKIIEKHNWFCAARTDDLIHLLHSLENLGDYKAETCRISCYHLLLVHIIKMNVEESNAKAFLILNDIILILKSKKASRKLAYDVLLATSSSLKDCHSDNSQSDLRRLFVMVMGYLSSESTHIMSGAVSALSLLIYNDAEFCLSVPNLIPSVLFLLQSNSNEVIKAALGFVKVLVSSVKLENLNNLVPDILKGILPWSEVTKYHFRSKVVVILDILIRKCGLEAVDRNSPKKYKIFLKSIHQARKNKKKHSGSAKDEAKSNSKDLAYKRGKKRTRNEIEEKGPGLGSKSERGREKKQRTNAYIANRAQKPVDRSRHRHAPDRTTMDKNRTISKKNFNQKTKEVPRVQAKRKSQIRRTG
ncbi:RRP12-like protein [Zingiber officinale]|uniref:RRP12-like protein n=1 Tax=Zingiber officinale TaxID=94328 RepID=UPI001C4BD5F4|nr:RRP12-like protein [Zingiber officinale]